VCRLWKMRPNLPVWRRRQFAIIDVDADGRTIDSQQLLTPLFTRNQIEVLVGAPVDSPENYASKQVLFDTGQSGMLFKNAEILGIDLADTDAIVISHGHYDHTGCVHAVLNTVQKAISYLHPKPLQPKFSRKGNNIRIIKQYMKDKAASKCPKCGHKVQRIIGIGAGVILRSSDSNQAEYPDRGSPACNRETPCCGRDPPVTKDPASLRSVRKLICLSRPH
jgi:hypothetical protein